MAISPLLLHITHRHGTELALKNTFAQVNYTNLVKISIGEPLEFCCKCLGTRPAHHYISIQPVLLWNTAGHQFLNTASHQCFGTWPVINALEHGQSPLLWNTASHHCFGTRPVIIASLLWNTASHHCFGTRPVTSFWTRPVINALEHGQSSLLWNTASHHCFGTRPVTIALEHGQSSLLWNTASHHCFIALEHGQSSLLWNTASHNCLEHGQSSLLGTRTRQSSDGHASITLLARSVPIGSLNIYTECVLWLQQQVQARAGQAALAPLPCSSFAV